MTKYSFNTNSLHFEPTDFLTVESGETLEYKLRHLGYDFLFEQREILNYILAFNRIHEKDLGKPAPGRIHVRLNHPKMYVEELRAHPCYQAYRNRSFSYFETLLHSGKYGSHLDRLKTQPLGNYEFLELGCGTGRAILELARTFPRAKITGICLPGESENLQEVAQFFDINMNSSILPTILETDLNERRLRPLAKGPFDFVFSQATLRYIKNKIELITDVYNELKVGGFAFLELRMIEIMTPKNHPIPLGIYFSESNWKNKMSFDDKNHLLFLCKTTDEPLEINLDFLTAASTYQPPQAAPQENAQVGWMSRYRIV